MSTGIRPTITLTKEDSWWVAKDTESGVASQGETREKALDNLDEAVALHEGEIGYEPDDAELEELGVDPENNRSGVDDATGIFE
ncbi:type II toxin-antitoxin system HicB family antitoxin [Halobaculum lipolyticum]|uniref:Type II toxin-antitoxin system HicB family antitoxin n=1 Tax=Halobaculum lipolyticum TaxID=3032001 RepID=A0ABD5WBE1_9EURY